MIESLSGGDPEALLDTLLSGGEHTHVDFKSVLDLTKHVDRIELAKDVGAFLDRGGWIIVGADNQGRPVAGLTEAVLPLWDESKLRSKLTKYLGKDFPLRVTTHTRGGSTIVLLHIDPHPDGCCVFLIDGQTGKGKDVFAAGDVYTRHGSASERVNQQDMARILRKRATFVMEAEAGAAAARDVAHDALREVSPMLAGAGPAQAVDEPCLVGAVGFCTARRPADLVRRIFYDDGFEHRLAMLLESSALRRASHYVDAVVDRTREALVLDGWMTCPGFTRARVRVVVRSDGAIALGFLEDTDDWGLDDLAAWWFYGAWLVAAQILGDLGCSGALYACHLGRRDRKQGRREVAIEATTPSAQVLTDLKAAKDFCRHEISRVHAAFAGRRSWGGDAAVIDVDQIRTILSQGRPQAETA